VISCATSHHRGPPTSLISKILLLIEQIGPRTTQVDNLRTPIPILLQARTLKAIEGVRNTLATTNDAFVLVVAKGALVADADECCGAHVAVAHRAFAVAFVAEAADGYAGLLAAHNKIAVEDVSKRVCMLGRGWGPTDDGETW
jgi:hypothetical protein